MSAELNISTVISPIGATNFLGESKKNYFEIPAYQREYTWSTDDWNAIYDDLRDSAEIGREHFIGTFMFIRVESEENNIAKTTFNVVDGQQRLTTLSILLLTMSRLGLEKLFEYRKESDMNIQLVNRYYYTTENDFLHNLDFIFISGYDNEKQDLKLTLSKCSNNNEEYEILAKDIYKHIVRLNSLDKDENIPDFNKETECDKRKKIWKAQNHFYNKLCDDIKEMSAQEACNYILKLAKSLSRWQGISITTDNIEQAHILFDSLNNRGVPLSPIDIVKNNLFKKMAEFDIDIDEKQEKWVKLLERTNSEKLLRRFFVDYYNIYYGKYSEKPRSKILTENNLIPTYSALIKDRNTKDKVNTFYTHLLDISKIYKIIVHPDTINTTDYEGNTSEFRYSLIHLNEISAVPSYVFLTFLYDKLGLTSPEDKEEELSLFIDIVNMLAKFFSIRHLTDVPRVKHLPALFDAWLQKYSSLDELPLSFEDYRSSFIKIITDPENSKKFKLESKASVRTKIEELEYDSQNTRKALIRYLFTLYELNNPDTQNTNSKYAYWKLWQHSNDTNKGEFLYSIEHIIPEGKKLPAHWKDMIGNDENIGDVIHRIGNLGILGPNKEAGQKPFEVKKKTYGNEKYRMFEEDVIPAEKWTRTEVEERTKKLAACMTDYLYEDFAELDSELDSE